MLIRRDTLPAAIAAGSAVKFKKSENKITNFCSITQAKKNTLNKLLFMSAIKRIDGFLVGTEVAKQSVGRLRLYILQGEIIHTEKLRVQLLVGL